MPVWGRLAKGTPKVSPNTIPNANTSANIMDLNLQYAAGVKTMTYWARVRSSNGRGIYNMQVTFLNVDPTEGLTSEEIQRGFYPKPSLAKHDVQLRCGCTNYRFRFDKANRFNRAGTGARFPAYHRKTNRKPNNPDNIPGFCGHLLTLIEYLQKQGFIF